MTWKPVGPPRRVSDADLLDKLPRTPKKQSFLAKQANKALARHKGKKVLQAKIRAEEKKKQASIRAKNLERSLREKEKLRATRKERYTAKAKQAGKKLKAHYSGPPPLLKESKSKPKKSDYEDFWGF